MPEVGLHGRAMAWPRPRRGGGTRRSWAGRRGRGRAGPGLSRRVRWGRGWASRGCGRAREREGAPRAGEAGADRAGGPSRHGCAAERQDAGPGLRCARMPRKQGKRKKGRGGGRKKGRGQGSPRMSGGVGRAGGRQGSGVR
eukprot:XP_020397164.1 uncharacterized protein LOC109941089 [Zea mays]